MPWFSCCLSRWLSNRRTMEEGDRAMAGESQQLPPGLPDPSVLTTEQMTRAVRAERDYVDGQVGIIQERLDGIDKASVVLNETVTRVPTQLQVAIGQVRELMDEKFHSVDRRFADNKQAVDSALAAQEKQAAAQDKSNQAAITKSEDQTAKTIDELKGLFTSETRAIGQRIDETKEHVKILSDRVLAIEQRRLGGNESTTERRDANVAVYALIGLIITIILATITIVGFVVASGSPTP